MIAAVAVEALLASSAAAAVGQWSADRGAAARMQRRLTARARGTALRAGCSAAVGWSATKRVLSIARRAGAEVI